MVTSHFDTFEDEKEISKLIKKLQSRSIEFMKQVEPWELPAENEKKYTISK